jgi:hypothetical protein
VKTKKAAAIEHSGRESERSEVRTLIGLKPVVDDLDRDLLARDRTDAGSI